MVLDERLGEPCNLRRMFNGKPLLIRAVVGERGVGAALFGAKRVEVG